MNQSPEVMRIHRRKKERFKQEILRFRRRWKSFLDQGDPYYSPNLSLMNGECRAYAKRRKFRWNGRSSFHTVRKQRNESTGMGSQAGPVQPERGKCLYSSGRLAFRATAAWWFFSIRKRSLPGSGSLGVRIAPWRSLESTETFQRREDHGLSHSSGKLGETVGILVSLPLTGEEKLLWYEASVKRLKEARRTPQFYLEEELVDGKNGNLYLRGWAADREQVKIGLFDQEKKKLPYKIRRSDRLDVQMLYFETEIGKNCGFTIEAEGVSGRAGLSGARPVHGGKHDLSGQPESCPDSEA